MAGRPLKNTSVQVEELECRRHFTFTRIDSLAELVSTTLPREVVQGGGVHANVVVRWYNSTLVRDHDVGGIDIYALPPGTTDWWNTEVLIRSKYQRLDIGRRPRTWVIPIRKIPSNLSPGTYSVLVQSSDDGTHADSIVPFSITVIPAKPKTSRAG
jgi:hypothetical protein